jgi:HK97 family phage portal protein
VKDKKMNLLQRIIYRTFRALGINTPGWTEYFAFGGGYRTSTGVRVDEHNALMISTVYQCVRYISDAVGQLPLSLFKHLPEGKEKAIDHPLYRIFHTAPNPFMPASIFKKTLQAHLLLWGNAYAEIERSKAGVVLALWPLRPDQMRMQVFNNRLFYYYTTPDGSEIQLTDVLHLRGLSSDGLVGYSPISLQREKLGLAKASEEYRARSFSNDMRPGGVLKHPAKLGDVAYERLRKSWEETHGGLSNARRVAILEEGLDWQDVGIPADDAQYIQGEEFTKADIAAIYGVPPYKIGLLKPGTVSFASVEQQAIDSVSDCIQPWVVCWEDCLNLALLTPTEQKLYFAKFNMNALLRGDSESRSRFYTAMFNIGVFTQNMILELEDQNTIGKLGDRRYVPLNYVPIDLVDKQFEQKQLTAPASGDDGNEEMKPKMLNGAAH